MEFLAVFWLLVLNSFCLPVNLLVHRSCRLFQICTYTHTYISEFYKGRSKMVQRFGGEMIGTVDMTLRGKVDNKHSKVL